MQRIPTSRWLTAWWPAGDLLTWRLLTMQGQLRPPVFAIDRRHPEVRRKPTSRHPALSGRGDGPWRNTGSRSEDMAQVIDRTVQPSRTSASRSRYCETAVSARFAVQRGRNGGPAMPGEFEGDLTEAVF